MKHDNYKFKLLNYSCTFDLNINLMRIGKFKNVKINQPNNSKKLEIKSTILEFLYNDLFMIYVKLFIHDILKKYILQL